MQIDILWLGRRRLPGALCDARRKGRGQPRRLRRKRRVREKHLFQFLNGRKDDACWSLFCSKIQWRNKNAFSRTGRACLSIDSIEGPRRRRRLRAHDGARTSTCTPRASRRCTWNSSPTSTRSGRARARITPPIPRTSSSTSWASASASQPLVSIEQFYVRGV